MIIKQNKRQSSVVITGASTGIGNASALHLDSQGFKVFAGVRKEKDADALKKKASDELIPVLIDVTDSSSINNAVKVVTKIIGEDGLHGLVNNPGILVGGPLEFLPISEFRKVFEVNILGHVRVIQAFLPLLRKRKGRIVNIGSMAGRITPPFVTPYTASKYAMESITDALRMELRPWRISVSIIEPGRVRTPMREKSMAASESLVKNLPLEAHRLYGPALSVFKFRKKEPKEISPLIVAKAVEHALTAKRPKARYVIGKDAKYLSLLGPLLPDRLVDWIIMKHLRIPL
jgi:NAD(P)-dependent dehydrogenase (short-subunit alcohol dehydrogenase family)